MKPLLTIILLFFLQNLAAQNGGCADTSYRMRFSSPGKDFQFYTHCNTKDGGTVLVGRLLDTASGTSDLVLMKLSATGSVVWKTKYGTPGNTYWYFSRIIEQSNGEIAAYGRISLTDVTIILVKWNANGAFLWSRNYYLNDHFDQGDELRPYFLSEGLNNELLFSFKGEHVDTIWGLNDSTYAVITRVSNNGNVIWSKVFTGTEVFFTHPAGVYEHNGEVYAFGYSDNFFANCYIGGYSTSLYAMRLDYTTGNLLQLKTYCHGGGIPNGAGIWSQAFGVPERDAFNSVKLLNNQFAVFGNFDTYNNKRYLYKILFNDQLNIVQAQQYMAAASLGWRMWMKVLPDGTTHFSTIGGPSRNVYWSILSPSNDIIRERKFNFSNGDTAAGAFLNFGYRNSETYNFSTNYRVNGRRFSFFIQLQRNDPSIDSCLGTDTSFISSTPINYAANSWMWRSTGSEAVLSVSIPLVPSDFLIETEPLCTQISRCDSLRIAGPDTVCTATFVNFTGLKNAACRKRVLWQLDNALVDSSYQPNDSTLSLRFKPLQNANAVTTQLFASAANCTVAKDTAQIILVPGLRPLPPDTVVCGAVNIRLTPGKWGKAYLWQDGSTDSVFTATDTGRYTVQVQTVCGTVFRDTFNITRPTVSLGADKTVCTGDSVTLRATQGFSNYQWRSGGFFLSTGGSSLTVSPSSTAQYIVAAQTSGGCTLSDTVIVNVLQPPPIHLGSDTTFCTGDSLRLQAPLSFSNYQWSNGSTGFFITVKASGSYWVKAVDAAGCAASDTLTVLPLYQNPVVSIVPKGVVCVGQSDTLRAGSFASYQWSNGSGKGYLPVADTGRYWLTVTDANGCTGSDTVSIKGLALPPAAFLPNDTIVCAGEAIELKPLKSFRNYSWSNGTSTVAITVNNAGLYVLHVTDGDGCTGADSIRLSLKDCLNRIYFPSGFTPNGDGKNDWLKPFVEGRMVEYSFTVYNRWGQVVFTTTDYRKGWDGRFSDALQTTGAFVWLCQYRFSGEEKKTAKGTVMLIR